MKALEIGSEPTLDLYVEHILEVYRQVKRVLREDGICWVNLGDRMTSGGRRQYDKSLHSKSGLTNRAAGVMRPSDPPGLKRKDLCMLPSRVAIALQADGWYLRSFIPWIKRNGMPESAEDRPAMAIEYILMLTKSEHVFYDQHAVKMAVSQNTHPRSAAASAFPSSSDRDENRRRGVNPKAASSSLGSKQNAQWAASHSGEVSARNRRNTDWFIESWQGLLLDSEGDPMAMVVNPKGTTIDHFASYPPKLVEPMIRCSTSDGGCCPSCGANLDRILVDEGPDLDHQKQCGGDDLGQYTGQAKKDYEGAKVQNASDVKRRILAGMRIKKTVGYKPSCECELHGLSPVPCRVIDCFHGTGTTAMVSANLGRDYLGCEISDEYFKTSDCRDGQTAMHLV